MASAKETAPVPGVWTEAVLVRGFRANGSQHYWLSRQSEDGSKDGLAFVYSFAAFLRMRPPDGRNTTLVSSPVRTIPGGVFRWPNFK
jgi:hypothetical protein